ncbi:hypothetical protein K435DRAFT_847140 [Dendrothele bispora CBS 962.96]|uniref:Elongator complex protein 5 n=1 Tax=Dendrothele bispora (strain CBS 962.96) TaxID=1314807 RepID=A0A4S8MYJ9_DENBC|nr:hypothetical protein K435DRAFT_847140 [Dendrothele bispora CBS 962.96]
MFPPLNLPDGVLALITDELPSPADFVLHQSIISNFKLPAKDSKRKAVILSVSESWTRWQAIAAKSNVNLNQLKDSGSLHLIDVVPSLGPSEGSDAFRALFDKITSIFDATESPSAPTLVILDDITALEWIGHSTLALSRFCRALRALCLKKNATLLIRHHLITPEEPDALFRLLYQMCSYHVDVRPLASGRSGAVSGEVALHAGPSLPPTTSVKLMPRSTALQYRLTESGVVFFERGSSRGVL